MKKLILRWEVLLLALLALEHEMRRMIIHRKRQRAECDPQPGPARQNEKRENERATRPTCTSLPRHAVASPRPAIAGWSR